MTPAELNAYQRDLVLRSELMQASRADRRDMPRKRPTAVVVVTQAAVPLVPAHVFVLPVVVENRELL